MVLVMAGCVAAGPAWCQVEDDTPPPALSVDPSLSTSIRVPPAAVTAGVADTGPALSSSGRALRCSALTPCAATSPAADRAMLFTVAKRQP
ncbi:MAG TPA: hypothetical protein VFI23_14860 [Rhizomicrobium sp.]|nr:hypothetical protein [Rhizomicrobium sp.]